MALEVVRNAPGSLHKQFQAFPEALRALSAHIHIKCLSSACSMTADCSENAGSLTDLPTFDVCVAEYNDDESDMDVTDAQAENSDHVHTLSTTADIEWAGMWPCTRYVYDPEEPNDPVLLECNLILQRRQEAVACRMVAKFISIEDVTINLADENCKVSSCIVLGRGPAPITLKNVSFKGAASQSSLCNRFKVCCSESFPSVGGDMQEGFWCVREAVVA